MTRGLVLLFAVFPDAKVLQTHRDPMSIINRIYHFIDKQLSADVAAAMATRIEAAPELSHGTHRYATADFGLTAKDIHACFGNYMHRFDLRETK